MRAMDTKEKDPSSELDAARKVHRQRMLNPTQVYEHSHSVKQQQRDP